MGCCTNSSVIKSAMIFLNYLSNVATPKRLEVGKLNYHITTGFMPNKGEVLRAVIVNINIFLFYF